MGNLLYNLREDIKLADSEQSEDNGNVKLLHRFEINNLTNYFAHIY